jgi:hypothetical protein
LQCASMVECGSNIGSSTGTLIGIGCKALTAALTNHTMRLTSCKHICTHPQHHGACLIIALQAVLLQVRPTVGRCKDCCTITSSHSTLCTMLAHLQHHGACLIIALQAVPLKVPATVGHCKHCVQLPRWEALNRVVFAGVLLVPCTPRLDEGLQQNNNSTLPNVLGAVAVVPRYSHGFVTAAVGSPVALQQEHSCLA